ncbi:MAG: hypothetical protein CVV64_00015 [Candidatus Wallbacteria bacterium HGW-Wallbacteria-1]|jgi:Na+-translocating ferredoxin:NAD+ oxidoreductase RnfD subunit|uniref:Ion-translocating oxidoreductase complex subunit D n=1 Tax=Candidatus Wallbacteria bacterium HGW-Wallbacteria-1 TaxID=2013854 RepID=A0A2N1PU30_9BACT|nr:MAG: hypothetical protein CVV64_00015 [Candidatus Wallbacteria bacterium HGW-Wallbacteria-1]
MRTKPEMKDSGFFKPLLKAMKELWNSEGFILDNPPFIREPIGTKRFMTTALIAMVPVLLGAIYAYGPGIVLMIAVSYITGGVIEVLWALIHRENISEGFLVTGLIFPLTLPPAFPLHFVALGIALTVIIGKIIFGGTGKNPFNPALVGRCILFLGIPEIFRNSYIAPGFSWIDFWHKPFQISTDTLTCATPLQTIKQSGFLELINSINDTLPSGLLEMRSGCCGEVFPVFIIMGGIYLLLCGTAKPSIWLGITLGSTVIMYTFLPELLRLPLYSQFLFTLNLLLMGGLPLGAVFMASDPVTAPVTSGARFSSGMIIGVTATVIRMKGSFPEGIMFGILMANLWKPFLDSLFLKHHASKLRKMDKITVINQSYSFDPECGRPS